MMGAPAAPLLGFATLSPTYKINPNPRHYLQRRVPPSLDGRGDRGAGDKQGAPEAPLPETAPPQGEPEDLPSKPIRAPRRGARRPKSPRRGDLGRRPVPATPRHPLPPLPLLPSGSDGVCSFAMRGDRYGSPLNIQADLTRLILCRVETIQGIPVFVRGVPLAAGWRRGAARDRAEGRGRGRGRGVCGWHHRRWGAACPRARGTSRSRRHG